MLSGQNLYFYKNHPIQWVRLVGVIVALDVFPNRITMTLDDSSGVSIEVFCKKDTCPVKSMIDTTVDSYGSITLNQALAKKDDEYLVTTSEGKVNLEMFDIGSVVKIKGGISEFRGEKQLTLQRISLVRTTNEEAIAWVENATFHKEVLCKPWVVSERQQWRAKEKAAGLDREREAKKERKRRKKDLAVKLKRGPHKDHEHRRGAEREQVRHTARRMSKPNPSTLSGLTKEINQNSPILGNMDSSGL
ncbi:MAG: hypothetical protein LQ337_001149 [Flavoplaca oasis]|nr:MAG: hypothetical protein LQ337_001149 [Flavoplaca oasis]